MSGRAAPPAGPTPALVPAALAPWVEAGVLGASDVHAARLIARLCGGADDARLLGAALAVRAPRMGHVCADLSAPPAPARDAAGESGVLVPAPPEPSAWVAGLAGWDAVGAPGEPGAFPLRLEGRRLYLDRMWADERAVAQSLLDRATRRAAGLGTGETLPRVLPGADAAEQRDAAALAMGGGVCVIAGGPGSGKTTTLGAMLASLAAEGALPPGRTALAAPTGRAAARLGEAVRDAAAGLTLDDGARSALAALDGTTLHRLLGTRPDSRTRFRHGPEARLPHRLVVVDEASMVPLALMARLLESLAEDAALVLVGDPHQLVSVEAGAVLGDIVGPAATGRTARGPLAARIAVLRRSHRFGGTIATLADAVRTGDTAAALHALSSGDPAVRWVDAEATSARARRAVAGPAREWAAGLLAASRAGDGEAALSRLGEMRVLAAHRRGPHGAEGLGALCEGLLAGAGAVPGHHYPGRPLIVTANDPALRVSNGDAGVIVARGDHPPALALPSPEGGLRLIAPARLPGVAPVHAMTIHRAQGSQFDHVVVVLAPPHSPVLTRELLYTAITRARSRLTVVGTRAAVETAIARPVARASGLAARLWQATP